MAADPFSDLRDHLHAAVNDAIAGLDYSHSQLLGQRISALSSAGSNEDLLSGLVCALVAESLGAGREPSMAAGTAFALVEASAYVVDDLVAAGSGSDVAPRGLIGAWGVPRTLNAADGFFAIGHESLMSLHDLGYDAATVLVYAAEFDAAVRAWSEESEQRFSSDLLSTLHPSPALLAAGAYLGARIGGLDNELARRLGAALAAGASADVAALPIDPSARIILADTATYLAGVAQK